MEIKPIQQVITCKNCGKIHSLDCYPIINFQSVDKEFLDKVFSLELFKIHCDCGATTITQYNTILVDMFKKYIVYLFVSDTPEKFYEEVKPAISNMFTENEQYKEIYGELAHTRLVCSINDMLEKLLIFDYDLNDEIVESIKLTLLNNKEIQDEKISKIYFDKIENTNLLFTLLSDDPNIQPKNIAIEIKYYNSILDKYKQYFNDFTKDEFALIDLKYVADKINTITENKNDTEDINE